MLVLGEHGKIAKIFACWCQLEVTLDLGRVVSDVLPVGCRQFMPELDKPVRQRAKTIFKVVSLVVAQSAFRLVEGDVAEMLDLDFSIVDNWIAHPQLGVSGGTCPQPAQQQDNEQRDRSPSAQRSHRRRFYGGADHPGQQPYGAEGGEIE